MQRSLLFKLLIILGLTILICIPMALVSNTIDERSAFRQQAIDGIAAESVREQTITGPIVAIAYTDEYEEVIVNKDEKGKDKKENVTRTVERTHLVFPNELAIDSDLRTTRRYRGIHQVLVYGGTHKFSGDIVLPAQTQLPRTVPASRVTVRKARVVLGVADVRGIRNIPKISWENQAVEFTQGTGLHSVRSGLQADLGVLPLAQPQTVNFAFTLQLDGIERHHVVPVAKNNKVTLKSDWPHPQFGGDFLPSPDGRTRSDSGFSVAWNISSLSTSAQQQLADNERIEREAAKAVDVFSVSFIEPVNVYSMAERATKYGLLFIALTFGAFFVFEILKRLPIHPVQYLLVGLALVLFFLLLVGLSEHIPFAIAYLSASAACIVLLGFYLSYVLHDWRRGMGFGVALTMLYGALYGLLISENNALVLGSLLLFAVLAAVMVATRKVDWYQLGKAEEV